VTNETPDRRRRTDKWIIALSAISFMCMLVCVVLAGFTLHNRATVLDIQQERLSACQDQNNRHDATIKEFDARIMRVSPFQIQKMPLDRVRVMYLAFLKSLPPTKAKRIAASHDFTLALIQALAPARDCTQVVRAG
jgi:hypothetical protein